MKRQQKHIVREEGGPTLFFHGLWPTATACPKCGYDLEREPAFFRCRHGCGKLWPVRGGAFDRQTDYERRSGLETPQPP